MNKLLLFFLILLQACAGTQYTINVKTQSLPQEDLEDLRICELKYVGDINPKSIEGKDFNRQIEQILTDRGITLTTAKKAKCTIGVSYGISGPFSQTHSAPIIGVTGTSSTTSYTTGTFNTYGNMGYGSATTNTYSIPRYGVTGYRYYNTSYYIRHLAMAAIDKNGDELWNANITNSSSSSDLQSIFPLLSYVAGSSIMTNTNNSVTISQSKAEEMKQKMSGTEIK